VEGGHEYEDEAGFRWPANVPNVLQDRKLTREQIKEIFFVHQTHFLKRPFIGYPEFEVCDIKADRERIKE
jgi:hypothetical protein